MRRTNCIGNRVRVSKIPSPSGAYWGDPVKPWIVTGVIGSVYPNAELFETWREAMDYAAGWRVTVNSGAGALNEAAVLPVWLVGASLPEVSAV
jgi:hypothetical protein